MAWRAGARARERLGSRLASQDTFQQAVALHRAGRLAEAERLYETVLAARPDHVEALYNRALALHRLRRFDAAIESYDRVLALRPDFVDALTNRGAALQDLGRYDEALAAFDRALAHAPDHATARYNRGLSLQHLQRHEEAIASYDHALAARPAFAEALNNRSLNLQSLGRLDEALAGYGRALAIKPDFAQALFNRGTVLSSIGRHAEASVDFERAISLDAELPYAMGSLLHSRMYCCDWRRFDEDRHQLLAGVRAGLRRAEPATILNISDSAIEQLQCARAWTEDKFPASAPIAGRYRHDRIRLGYLSADFHDHATAHLMAGLFERHDRTRFETYAFSFGRAANDPMRKRLLAAFDRFIDVRSMSDGEAAALVRSLEIDIAIDLKGFTDHARTGILARRPAPIQVNYLGYPGTMGTPFVDYIVADAIVIPQEHHGCYAEKVVSLPDSYQVNDSNRSVAASTLSRAEAGLPEQAFVFCSFNNAYKVTPAIFDVWMRLLKKVDASVLWLLEGEATANQNLRREAARRGVDAVRLVFAPRVAHADHLARHRLADLFLDTLPCNAHTTASDALWMGLPLVTCLGRTFAGRVAASLLHAAGLPDLVADDLAAYEALALRLATDRRSLAAQYERLARNRDRCPLFDTDRSTRHLEAAFIAMWERDQRGLLPASFSVAPRAERPAVDDSL